MDQFWYNVVLQHAWRNMFSHGFWTLQDDFCGKAWKAQEFVLKLQEPAPFPTGVIERRRAAVFGETLYETELPYHLGMVLYSIWNYHM